MLSLADAGFTQYLSTFSGREVRRVRVGKSATSSFRQIADAIRASRPYDRIEVESGRYFEALSVKHPIELCSANDGEPPVIVSRGPCLTISADGPVLIQSLNIVAKGTTVSNNQSILIERGSPLIQDCELSSVYVINDATPHVLNCHICNSDHGCGLSISGRSGGVYMNNEIGYHNDECVYINTSGKPELSHNRISQKSGNSSTTVKISGRLLNTCEPIFRENIIRGGKGVDDENQIDPTSVYSPKMLIEDDLHRMTCLVCVSNGAVPLLVGNVLCNGVTGFSFRGCTIPPERFYNNRVAQCTAWGVAIGTGTSLVARGNDIQCCGGGIYVYTAASGPGCEANSPRVTLLKCDLRKNYHYGILIQQTSVLISECTVSNGSVGIAFLGNCSASTITKNELTNNSVAGFSVLRRGVVVIENNTVCGSGNGMYGAFIQDGSKATLRSNRMGRVSTTIFVRNGSRIIAEKNRLREASVHHLVLMENSKGTIQENNMESSKCASVVATGRSECVIHRNFMYSSLKEGVLVEDGAKATIEQNSMGSMREAIYVKTGGSVCAKNNDVTLGHYGIVVEGQETTCAVLGNRLNNLNSIAVYALNHASITVMDNALSDMKCLCMKFSSGAEAIVEKNSFIKSKKGGVFIDGMGTQCKVLYCHMEGIGYGVKCSGCSTAVIQGNCIHDCEQFGVGCDSESLTLVRENNIAGANTGILLSSSGDIHDNTIANCGVGILACKDAVATARDLHVADCVVGVFLGSGTRVSITAVEIQRSTEFGVVVDGPSADVKVCSVTIEKSSVAGVVVQKDGICRFESCILRNNQREGIRLDHAGEVVFEHCVIMDSCQGIKVSRDVCDAHAAGKPLLVNCTIDGDLCEKGVLGTAGGVVRLEMCKISARCPENGSGIVAQDNAMLLLSKCDIRGCPRAGVSASPTARTVLEHTTIDKCGIGIFFASPSEQVSSLHELSRTVAGSGDAVVSPRVTQLTIRNCTEAGIFYEPWSAGAVSCTTVEECADGVNVQCGSYVKLHTTIVRASTRSGIVFLGAPSNDSELTQLTISDSGEYGVKVCQSVDTAVADVSNGSGDGDKGEEETETKEGKDEAPHFTIIKSEIVRNTKGGIMLEACVCIDGCKIAHNTVAGVIYEGKSSALLSNCHLEQNEDTNILVHAGSMPQLRECVIENAALGVSVHSALRMLRCIVRHLGVAVAFFTGDGTPHSSSLTECIFSSNETAVSFTGGGALSESATGVLRMDKCSFRDNSLRGVYVEGGLQALIQACNFESSSEGVQLVDGAEAVIDGCTFTGNLGAVSILNVRCVQVHKSVFTRQLHFTVRVTGDSGDVRIRENIFKESGQHGVLLSNRGAVISVSGNSFYCDACGIVVQSTSKARVYNNHFRACQTGVVLRGEGSCGYIFSNVFEQNVCGCRCEEESSAQLWRNEFNQNTQYGLVSTTEAKPVVVENSFTQHGEDKSAALCISGRGTGHFAFNRYAENACGVRLEHTCNTVMMNNSTFTGNSVAMDLREGASVHVVGCIFASSTSGDVRVSGSTEPRHCIFAYNCFASRSCAAVSVSQGGSVVVFCSVFWGAESKGVVLQDEHGDSMVFDSLFYRVGCGVYVGKGAAGTVGNSTFVHCATAVEVCAHARSMFHGCKILTRPSGTPTAMAAVVIHEAAAPTFKRCSFAGWVKTAHPLLLSRGGGVVEDSSFTAGDLAVLLDCNCTMRLRKNTFLGGVIGVKFNPGSRARVEGNSFFRYHVAAVKIMDNAAGELTANAFLQPLENGGILAGVHHVILDSCKQLPSTSKRSTKLTVDETALEPNFLADFVERLEMAPYWARKDMTETARAAMLPETVLSAMGKSEAVGPDGEQAEAAVEAERVEGQNDDDDDGGGGDDGGLKKSNPTHQHEGVGKKSKMRRKGMEMGSFEFAVSDTIVSAPQDVQNALMAWVKEHGITLSVQRQERYRVQESHVQVSDTEMLTGIVEHVSAMTEGVHAERRGNFADAQRDELRGATLCRQENTDNGKEITVTARRAEEGGGGSGEGVVSEPHETSEGSKTNSSIALVGTSNAETKLRATAPSTNSGALPCIHLDAEISASGIPKSKTHKKARKKRRTLPPPLRSNDANAHPACSPHRGMPLTFAACLRECGTHKFLLRARKGAKVDPLRLDGDLSECVMMNTGYADQFKLLKPEYDGTTWCDDTFYQFDAPSGTLCVGLEDGSSHQFDGLVRYDNGKSNDPQSNGNRNTSPAVNLRSASTSFDVRSLQMLRAVSGGMEEDEWRSQTADTTEEPLPRKDTLNGNVMEKTGNPHGTSVTPSATVDGSGMVVGAADGRIGGRAVVTVGGDSSLGARNPADLETPLRLSSQRATNRAGKVRRNKRVKKNDAIVCKSGTSSVSVRVPTTGTTTTIDNTVKEHQHLAEAVLAQQSLLSTMPFSQTNERLDDEGVSLSTDSASRVAGDRNAAILSVPAESRGLISEARGKDAATHDAQPMGASTGDDGALLSAARQADTTSALVGTGTGAIGEAASATTGRLPKGESAMQGEGGRKADAPSEERRISEEKNWTNGAKFTFPQLAASSLSTNLSRKSTIIVVSGGGDANDGGSVVEIPLPVMFSERGRALLNALEDDMLRDEPLPQGQAQAGIALSIRPKTSGSPGSTSVTPLLGTVGGLCSKSEEEEELEDIIALLRWLADMREKKLMGEKRFTLCVDCIQARTEIPFFFCDRDGQGPTLMVRLPQAPDEVVAVPLLGAPLHLPRLSLNTGDGTHGANNLSPRCGEQPRAGVIDASENTCDAGAGLGWVAMPWPWRNHIRANDAGFPAVRPPHLKVYKPTPLIAHAKFPPSHFRGQKELPAVLRAAFRAQPWPQMSTRPLTVLHAPENRSVNVSHSTRVKLRDGNQEQPYSFQACARKPSQSGATGFNPAAPQETSPYTTTLRTAAFIAIGTTNFMI